MESIFPYDTKWETAKFTAPYKPIINYKDVDEYKQRPIHDEYLNFLTDLQKVLRSPRSPFSPRRSQTHLTLLNLPSLCRTSND